MSFPIIILIDSFKKMYGVYLQWDVCFLFHYRDSTKGFLNVIECLDFQKWKNTYANTNIAKVIQK